MGPSPPTPSFSPSVFCFQFPLQLEQMRKRRHWFCVFPARHVFNDAWIGSNREGIFFHRPMLLAKNDTEYIITIIYTKREI